MRSFKNHTIPLMALTLLIATGLACAGTAAAPPQDESAGEIAAPDTAEPEPSAAAPTVAPEPTSTPQPTATDVPLVSTPESIGVSGPGSSDIEALVTGTWKSVCMDIGSEVYLIITTVFGGAGQGNDVVVFYSDPNCASATGMVKTNQTSYALGDSITAGEKNAYAIDITINAWELTQDGAVISSGTDVPTQYDIVAVENDILYNSGVNRADPGAIMTPDDRPTTLDLANFYTRQ